jgi:hypothetical protein
MAEEMKDKEPGQISRREFIKDAGLCAGCAAVGGAALLSGCAAQAQTETVTTTVTSPPVTKTVQVTATPAPISLELMNPAGDQEITQLFAPRLSTLDGKKVAFLACDPTKWQPHRIFPAIQDALKKLYPTISFLPHTQFTIGSIEAPAVAAAVKAAGADACITGCAA